jgi:hypothetical protein
VIGMAYIEDASEEQAGDLYDADRARAGYVANYTRLFARRPAVNTAWKQLITAIQADMDPRRARHPRRGERAAETCARYGLTRLPRRRYITRVSM